MDEKKLLPQGETLYESHVYPRRELPFIFRFPHTDRTWFCNLHENPEILYFRSGQARVLVGEETVTAEAGDLVFVGSHLRHQVAPEGFCVYFCIIPDIDFCRSNGLPADRTRFPALIRDEKCGEKALRVIEEYLVKKEYSDAGIRCSVLDLLLELFRRYGIPTEDGSAVNQASFEYVRRGVDYLREHFSERLTVEQIASAVGLSKYHFLRIFKQATGTTVISWLNSIRCCYAKELFLSGCESVNEVALRCGFENPSYFTQVFRKYTGRLPSAYLERNKTLQALPPDPS